MSTENNCEKVDIKALSQDDVSGSVDYIQLLSTGTKAYWDESCQHFVSENRRFHVSLELAINRNDMYIHYH